MKRLLALTLPIASKVMGQGSYFDINGSNFSSYPISEIITINGPMPIFEYDEVLHHYRSDVRKREPQFLGFDIQDDNIEIDMEIAVPFLSVPKKYNGIAKNKNFANINVAAVILAGVVAIGGTLLGGAARFFKGDSFFSGPYVRSGNKKKKHKQKRDIQHDEFVWDIFNNIDNALLQIDFDVRACTQRSICWHVKNSLINVEEKQARKIDTFIAGFINADWKHHVISNPYWIKAIEAGKKGLNCEKAFKTCAISPHNLESFSSKIQKYAKPKSKPKK